MSRVLALTLITAQTLLAVRFLRVLLRTGKGTRIRRSSGSVRTGATSVIVPVLNEERRLDPCLSGLSAQPEDVREILVVDGGSVDGTAALVRRWEGIDSRIRLVPAGEPRPDWNGKAWGLQVGLDSVTTGTSWIATLDADVRCEPGAINAAVEYADGTDLPVLSVATRQDAPTPGLSLVHPSLLATLVYRFGAPGHAAGAVSEVQSNGQFAIYRQDALRRAGGFVMARDSICEDVTLARHLHLLGEEVGFVEGDGLATTEMYADGWECLTNWPRSLSLRDRIRPHAGTSGLLNIVFLQTLPLLVAIAAAAGHRNGMLVRLNRILLASRVGIAVGTRRAYAGAYPTYWASPLVDPITLVAYLRHLVGRRRVWRGRELVRAD